MAITLTVLESDLCRYHARPMPKLRMVCFWPSQSNLARGTTTPIDPMFACFGCTFGSFDTWCLVSCKPLPHYCILAFIPYCIFDTFLRADWKVSPTIAPAILKVNEVIVVIVHCIMVLRKRGLQKFFSPDFQVHRTIFRKLTPINLYSWKRNAIARYWELPWVAMWPNNMCHESWLEES
jgi:hypothetical protein